MTAGTNQILLNAVGCARSTQNLSSTGAGGAPAPAVAAVHTSSSQPDLFAALAHANGAATPAPSTRWV